MLHRLTAVFLARILFSPIYSPNMSGCANDSTEYHNPAIGPEVGLWTHDGSESLTPVSFSSDSSTHILSKIKIVLTTG
jgi:hypothetical protein